MMVSAGDSGVNDFIRNDLEKNHPQIHIEDTPYFYDLSVFNRCAETRNVLLTIECWQEVHPEMCIRDSLGTAEVMEAAQAVACE